MIKLNERSVFLCYFVEIAITLCKIQFFFENLAIEVAVDEDIAEDFVFATCVICVLENGNGQKLIILANL